jgi:hypothetical protein
VRWRVFSTEGPADKSSRAGLLNGLDELGLRGEAKRGGLVHVANAPAVSFANQIDEEARIVLNAGMAALDLDAHFLA